MPVAKVNIIQDTKHPIAKDVLAKAICQLSDCSNALLSSGLNEKAVIVLLADTTKVAKKTIKKVLDAMGQLRVDYTHD